MMAHSAHLGFAQSSFPTGPLLSLVILMANIGSVFWPKVLSAHLCISLRVHRLHID